MNDRHGVPPVFCKVADGSFVVFKKPSPFSLAVEFPLVFFTVILTRPLVGGSEYCFLDAWLDFDSHFFIRMGKGSDLAGFVD